MDNLTHSAAGLLVAELAIRDRERKGRAVSAPIATAARWLSLAANNLPDADLLYSRLIKGPLGYLLHHRGYTHTLLLAAPEALLVWAIAVGVLRLKKGFPTRGERGWLFLLALVGIALHIALDALNSYGVHPFWPLDNRWYYGDSLFIAEPWLWFSWLPVLWWVDRSRAARAVLFAFAGAALLLLWLVPFVPWYAALAVTLWGLLLGVLARRLTPFRRALAGALAGALVIAGFGVTSARIKKEFLRDAGSGRHLVDVALTPYPANPFCWDAVGIGSHGNRYELVRATVAAFPRLVAAGRCPYYHPGSSVPLTDLGQPDSASIAWRGHYEIPLERWRELARNPWVLAFLRFSRAPCTGEGPVWVGDFRFDRGGRRGFTVMDVPPPVPGPSHVPPWEPPRRELLLSP